MNIRTAVAAPLIGATLLVGGVVAPAHAEDPTTPPECDQAVQEWRDRSDFWEGKFLLAQQNLNYALADLRAEDAESDNLLVVIGDLRTSLTAAKARGSKWQDRAEHRGAVIDELRAKLRAARNR